MDVVSRFFKSTARRKDALSKAPPRGCGDGGVVVEGYVLKKGIVVSTWKERWCSVEGGRASCWLYYGDDRDSAPRGAFSLQGARCTMTKSKKNAFVLEITWPQQQGVYTRRLAMKTKAELETWFDAITSAVGQCEVFFFMVAAFFFFFVSNVSFRNLNHIHAPRKILKGIPSRWRFACK